MATVSQITANRLNAQSSTGPTTPEGRQAASRNAVRHGLYASLDSLPAHDKLQVESILAHFRLEFPNHAPEAERHFNELALAWFRRERVRSMEAAFFDHHLDVSLQNVPGLPRDRAALAILTTDCEHSGILMKLHRLERAYTRDIDRALKSLNEQAISSDNEIAETKPISGPRPAAQHPEPARNAPCPCGSGLKYKRCCGHARPSAAPNPDPKTISA
jgi:hypothetical protein